jgi:hypothetical protein
VAGAAGAAGIGNALASAGALKQAVETGDFAKAQEQFGKLEGVWNSAKAGIQAKSPDAFKALEASVPSLKAAIESKDKEKALKAIQEIAAGLSKAK